MPSGTYFLYAAAPRGCKDREFANAEEASQFLITEQSVCCVPWDDAGAFLASRRPISRVMRPRKTPS